MIHSLARQSFEQIRSCNLGRIYTHIETIVLKKKLYIYIYIYNIIMYILYNYGLHVLYYYNVTV